MKSSERRARKALAEHHGVQHIKGGTVAGNMKDEGAAPTTVLTHGPISRLLGRPPTETRTD
jgi:hypothetical protein